MFHNIFKRLKEKPRLNKPSKKPKIIADIHEKNSLIISELKSNPNIELEIKQLKIADYLIGKIAVERKTINDFISSMLNKRLIQQLNQLQQYKNKLLIIEGNFENLYQNLKQNSEKKSKLNLNAIRGFILSIIINYQIPIIFTQNYQDTADYLIILAKQQIKSKSEISLHSRIPKAKKEQQKYILESFENIGPKTAHKLLKNHKTLKGIFNTNQEQLAKNIGKKASSFKILDEEY